LQKLGTEACREAICDDIWVKSLERKINAISNAIIFVNDVRFDNEAEFIIKSGGIIVNITREHHNKISSSDHKSEKGITPSLIDYTIINRENKIHDAVNEIKQIIINNIKE
jgi:hypothetical protein